MWAWLMILGYAYKDAVIKKVNNEKKTAISRFFPEPLCEFVGSLNIDTKISWSGCVNG
jgi:hypothetical protein